MRSGLSLSSALPESIGDQRVGVRESLDCFHYGMVSVILCFFLGT